MRKCSFFWIGKHKIFLNEIRTVGNNEGIISYFIVKGFIVTKIDKTLERM